MKNGTTTALDIRDGNVREHDVAEGSKDGLGAREWLKAHGLTKTKSKDPNSSAEEHDAEPQSDAKASAGSNGFLSAFGFGKTQPTVPLKTDEDTAEGDGEGSPERKQKTEEDILRERGWGPPIMRRLTSRVPRKSKAPVEYPDKDIQEEGDGEEIEIPEAEEANGGARPERKVCRPVNPFSPN
ncbi:hypothetical protein GYMLUDRAFT_710006 [Collybiopsis luxurians FD-317 M1]|nr:hypothetical protein GYMLUDRAFT_710006 [Collybiopsis luxurians FD-317 M1]